MGLPTAQSFALPAFLLPLDFTKQQTCTGHRDVRTPLRLQRDEVDTLKLPSKAREMAER